jgi:hypothetical protein
MVINRHSRGKASINADVCPTSILDKDSFADAGSTIWHSNISKSWIQGKVLGSAIRESRILAGEVVSSTIIGSTLNDGRIYGSHVQDSIINGGLIRGGRVMSCEISGGTIQGGAVVFGLHVHSDMRIGSGLWGREPRYFEIQTGSVKTAITESTDGSAYINCQCKPMAVWIKGKRRFGKTMGWSDEVLDLLETRFTEWLDNPLPTY